MRRILAYRGRSLEITKAGWIFILLSLLVGFAAINSGSNLLHILFGAQMGIIIASGVLSESMLRRVEVARRPSGPVHAGLSAPLEIEVRNRHPRGPLVSITVQDDLDRPGEGTTDPAFSLVVAAQQRAGLSSAVTMQRRGRYRLPPAVAATAFPFGLFVKRRQLVEEGEILVFPQLDPSWTSTPLLPHVGDGEFAGARSRTGEFFGLEEYRAGMDTRRIHWPATARRGQLVVQEFESRGQKEEFLSLDAGVRDEPVFEAEVVRVASRAAALLRRGHVATGLRYAGELVIPPQTGLAQERRLLGFLAEVGDGDGEGVSP